MIRLKVLAKSIEQQKKLPRRYSILPSAKEKGNLPDNRSQSEGRFVETHPEKVTEDQGAVPGLGLKSAVRPSREP